MLGAECRDKQRCALSRINIGHRSQKISMLALYAMEKVGKVEAAGTVIIIPAPRLISSPMIMPVEWFTADCKTLGTFGISL